MLLILFSSYLLLSKVQCNMYVKDKTQENVKQLYQIVLYSIVLKTLLAFLTFDTLTCN